VVTLFWDCLDKFGIKQSAENKPVEAKPSQAETGAEPKNDGGDSLFGDNPWVQILRVRYGSQNA